MDYTLDLGGGYRAATYTCEGMQGPCGIIVEGPAGPNCLHHELGRCAGHIVFEGAPPKLRGARWQVESLEPLTLTPSVRCGCDTAHPGTGQHGYIRQGMWENAGGGV